MCSPLDPITCPDAVARGLADAAGTLATNSLELLLSAINDQLHAGIKTMAVLLAGWILVPSTQVCPTGGTDWMAACATGSSPSAQLRAWMLPITVLIAVGGMLWQAILLAVTRKGQPLITVMRGLATTAVWGAIGIAATQLALRAGDTYAHWILQQAVFGDSPNPVDDVGTAIADMTISQSYTTAVVLVLLNVPILLVTVAQIILMIFREGAVVILAGQLQLAAAGSFTRLTSGWLSKVAGWMLALIAYKPVAASVYAVAFLLLGDGFRNQVMGLAVLFMALVAMPALMKFFTWTVGTVGTSGGGGLWMFGTSVAAGLHAASSLRGVGGYRAADHAGWLDTHGPSGSGPSGGGRPGGPPPMPPQPPTPAGPTTPASPPPGPAGGSGLASAAGAGTAGAATAGAGAAAMAAGQVVDTARRAADRAASTVGDAMHGR